MTLSRGDRAAIRAEFHSTGDLDRDLEAVFRFGRRCQREADAKICDEYAVKMRGIKGAGGRDCAAAIRANTTEKDSDYE